MHGNHVYLLIDFLCTQIYFQLLYLTLSLVVASFCTDFCMISWSCNNIDIISLSLRNDKESSQIRITLLLFPYRWNPGAIVFISLYFCLTVDHSIPIWFSRLFLLWSGELIWNLLWSYIVRNYKSSLCLVKINRHRVKKLISKRLVYFHN